MPMLESAAGDQHKRIFRIGPLRGRNDLRGNESTGSGRGWKVFGEYHALAGVALVLARVRNGGFLLQAVPGDPGNRGHGPAHLLEHLARMLVVPIEPEPPAHGIDDPQILTRVARRLEGLAAELHRTI